MSCKIFSGAVIGLDTQIIEVESDISYGLRSFDIDMVFSKDVTINKQYADFTYLQLLLN